MKISVIMASYNYAQYLEEAINSVINQSHQDWELIIVDDGSSDNSVEIIKSYCEKDNRIKFFQHPDGKNKGLKETLLLGLSHATGEWIAFLESDDYLSPDNLSKKIDIVQKYPDVKLIFNCVEILKDEKCSLKRQKNLENTYNKLRKMIFPKNMFYDFYINNMILTFSSVMVEKNALKDANYNATVDVLLDWWLWIHLAYKNKFYYIDEKLTFWRLHHESYLTKGKKPLLKWIQLMAYHDVYQKNEKPFRILFYIIYSTVILFFVKSFKFFKKFIYRLIFTSKNTL